MAPRFYNPQALDPGRFSPRGNATAKGLDALLMAWLDSALGILNDTLQRRAYEEIFGWIRSHRDDKVFSYRYPGGMIGYIRDPAGVLIQETWNSEPDLLGVAPRWRAFRSAAIYGWGSTAGSALVQGKSGPAIRRAPSLGDYHRYVFFDFRQMRLLGGRNFRRAGLYRPEIYRLHPVTGLLEWCAH